MRPAVLVLAFILSLLSANAAQAAKKVTILLDWFVNPDHAALIIARERGFFTKVGLDVELIAPADPNAPPKLVAAGQADLAITYQPQLHMQVAGGLPLVRVGALVDHPLNTLIVLADGPVRSIADLKGRRVGYSVGGFEEALLGTMLEKDGLTLKDVTLVNVNFNLSAALLSGQVDAVVGGFRNFELNQLELENRPGRAFLPEEHGVPSYEELILVAHRERLDRETIGRVLAALTEATAWLKANPQRGWELFVKQGKELDTELNRRAWRDTVPRLTDVPNAVDRTRYAQFAEYLRQRGLLSETLPLDRYIADIR